MEVGVYGGDNVMEVDVVFMDKEEVEHSILQIGGVLEDKDEGGQKVTED